MDINRSFKSKKSKYDDEPAQIRPSEKWTKDNENYEDSQEDEDERANDKYIDDFNLEIEVENVPNRAIQMIRDAKQKNEKSINFSSYNLNNLAFLKN